MKKLIIVFLSIVLLLPVYAQNNNISFARRYFDFGIDVGAGFDNDLIKSSDILSREIVIDLTELSDKVRDNGLSVNFGIPLGLFFNIKNIPIANGRWDIGFFSGVDGNVNFNMPKSIFTLIAEGNLEQRYFDGMISAAGGIYANAGMGISAKYGRLRVGLKPDVFTPLVFIPRSGINYKFITEEKVIHVETSGDIRVYSPFLTEDGQAFKLNFGADVSLEGQYALLSFLDVGGSLSRIPLGPAKMQNGMRMTMSQFNFPIGGYDLTEEVTLDIPELTFEQEYGDIEARNVFRPFRFDIYARYKPFGELLVVRPNMGFSVDGNNNKGYFNIGLEGRVNLIDLFMFYLGTSLTEAIWKQQIGFVLNLRAFELGLATSFRSESFAGSFSGQGLGINLGLRFGW